MRTFALTLAAALLLVGCGGQDSDDQMATDPAATTDPSATTTPAAEPTVGTYPPFEADDYAYTLHVQCFCLGSEDGIRVTVRNGEVVDARLGDQAVQAEPFRRLTINDVIDAANDTDAAQVDVRWPAGQDYPRSVWIDRSKRIADEEIGYQITDVVVG